MSKYTTEIRFICESLAGYDQSQGRNKVNEIIAAARPKIFDFEYPLFDNDYKSVLETKILKHYYTREIGLETFGLWQLKLETKLNEILPYYNKLYESELLEFNPLYAKDIHKTFTRKGKTDNSSSTSGETNGSISATSTDENSYNSKDRFSETPQGTISDLEDDTYLTNARVVDDTENKSNSRSQTSHDTNSANAVFNGNSLDEYTEHVYGYESGGASKLLNEFRETFLNVDLLIINELDELFFGLW